MSTPLSRKVNPKTGLTFADCAFLEAYLRLGDASKAHMELHPGATEGTCRQAANARLKKPAIIAYIARHQLRSQMAAGVTLSEHLMALAALRNLAIKQHKYRDAIYAEELRGRASGHYKINFTLHHKLTPEMAKAIDLDGLSEDELSAVAAGDITESLFARLAASARAAQPAPATTADPADNAAGVATAPSAS